MKKLLSNNQGIALVTSLMLTLISLTIVMAVMYMITLSTQQSGMAKRYKSALEASYGGTDIVMKELVPEILKNVGSATLFDDLKTKYALMNLDVSADVTVQQCIQQKLNLQFSEWAACTALNTSINPKEQPDLTFRLQAANGAPYTVYAKIVDTLRGNTDMSGLQLEGAGVAESLTVLNPKNIPYVYRMEIQAERSTNAAEQGNMTVVYAY
ncbi:hypothetical protein [Trichlorobacter lovleyi]|uniref:hypothetical protein n=1 Tax=Trichlorobacter lovleyi TaxID=313985 RepID=UPI0023F07C42|nr:hypothetical protein [Trichlorobacter lovleyi]